ncbi:M15 family metallopeptidase (plasmid) [Streptomyces sp. BI20]|uniref:M15 family metallopeptidase n=1 Tax=Streptomyces sp. BI20 TaxID=3403460 RepID=UPI003C78C108
MIFPSLCRPGLRPAVLAVTTAVAVGLPAPPARAATDLGAVVTSVPAAKLGASHHAGCPVSPGRLRLISMNHWGFDGKVHRGELIVRDTVVQDVLGVFGAAFTAKFPIRRMRVMAEYGGDDVKAMNADNTSAFNCRAVTGVPDRLSRHSYGDAIDVNPLENPYVDVNGRVYPDGGEKYLKRSTRRPGMIFSGDAVNKAFAKAGWRWGGRWSPPDYQHFSRTGA